MGDRPGEAETLHSLALSTPEPDLERAHLEACVALAREIDHAAVLVLALNSLGYSILRTGDLDRARALLEEGVALAEKMPERRSLAHLQGNLAWVSARQGRLVEAREHLAQCVEHQRSTSNLSALAEFLSYVARIALEIERPLRAARLLGAVEAVYRHAGAERPQFRIDEHAQTEARIRDQLGEANAERERAAGAALDFEAALALALDAVSPDADAADEA
jgi:Flp pilus assembly protein TadD